MGKNTPSDTGHWTAAHSRVDPDSDRRFLYIAFRRGGFFLTVLAILSACPAIVCLALFSGTAFDLVEIVASVFRTRVGGLWRSR